MFKPLQFIIILFIFILDLSVAELSLTDFEMIKTGKHDFILFNITADDDIGLHIIPMSSTSEFSTARCDNNETSFIIFQRNRLGKGETSRALAVCEPSSEVVAIKIYYFNFTSKRWMVKEETIELSIPYRELPEKEINFYPVCFYDKNDFEKTYSTGKKIRLGEGETYLLRIYYGVAGGTTTMLTGNITAVSWDNKTVKFHIEIGQEESDFIVYYGNKIDEMISIGNLTFYNLDYADNTGELWVFPEDSNILSIFMDEKIESSFFGYALSFFPDRVPMEVTLSFDQDFDLLYIEPWIYCSNIGAGRVSLFSLGQDSVYYYTSDVLTDVSKIHDITGNIKSVEQYISGNRIFYNITSEYIHYTCDGSPEPIHAVAKWLCDDTFPDMVHTDFYSNNIFLRGFNSSCPLDFPVNKGDLRGRGSFTWIYKSSMYPFQYNFTVLYNIIDPIEIISDPEVYLQEMKDEKFYIKNIYKPGNFSVCVLSSDGFKVKLLDDDGDISNKSCVVYRLDLSERIINYTIIPENPGEVGVLNISVSSSEYPQVKVNRSIKLYYSEKALPQFDISLDCQKNPFQYSLNCSIKLTNTGNIAATIVYQAFLLGLAERGNIVTVPLLSEEMIERLDTIDYYPCAFSEREAMVIYDIDRLLFYLSILEQNRKYIHASGFEEKYTLLVNRIMVGAIRNNKTAYAIETLNKFLSDRENMIDEAYNALLDYRNEILRSMVSYCKFYDEKKVLVSVISCLTVDTIFCQESNQSITINNEIKKPKLKISPEQLILTSGDKSGFEISFDINNDFPVMVDFQQSSDCDFLPEIKYPGTAIKRFQTRVDITAPEIDYKCYFNLTARPRIVSEGNNNYDISESIFISIYRKIKRELALSLPKKLDVKAGSKLKFYINVTNLGNDEDILNITVKGDDILKGKIMPVNFEQPIGVAETVRIPIELPVPTDIRGLVQIHIEVASATDKSIIKSGTIDVNLLYTDVSVELPKEIRRHTVIRIKNTGNLAGQFKLYFQGELQECVSIDKPQVELSPGEEIEVVAAVICRPEEMYNKKYEVKLYIDSDGIKKYVPVDLYVPEVIATDKPEVTKIGTPTAELSSDTNEEDTEKIRIETQLDILKNKIEQLEEGSAKRVKAEALLSKAYEEINNDNLDGVRDLIQQINDAIAEQEISGKSSTRIIVILLIIVFILILTAAGILYYKNLEKQRQIRANIQRAISQYGHRQNMQYYSSGYKGQR